ncbi:MAG: Fic family protein [Candidatus Saccharimonas sp.]
MTETLTTPQKQQREPTQDNEGKLAKTVMIMERLHAAEIFSTPEQSKAFLNSLNYDEFKKYISFVNGIERDIPASQRGKVSNSRVQSESGLMGTDVDYRPPHQSLRDQLLEMAFKKAQDTDEPEMAGLTLGLSLNAIHYFADGNGRTARMVYTLFTKGYDGSPETQAYYSALLENTKGREVVNPNPAISGIDQKIRSEMFLAVQEKHGYSAAIFDGNMPTHIFDGYPNVLSGEYSPEELAVASDIDAACRLRLYDTMESGGMTMISLMAAFKPDRVKPFVKTSRDGTSSFIDGNMFLPTLSKEEIIHWWNASERAIASYVKRLIDVADREDVAEIAAHYRGKSS